MNAVYKTNKKSLCKVCFAFPDLYEIGMSHLGLQILYTVINNKSNACCERVFAPASDLEKILVEKKTPLSSLESNIPLYTFDIVGFTLQYELTYTNILNMLNLGRIPLYAHQRKEGPLIIAGGPCSVNPEVMTDFIDVFVIGDGEELFPQLIDLYLSHKNNNPTNYRHSLLKTLSTIKGIYIPSFYKVSYTKNNTKIVFQPLTPDTPERIEKTTIQNLNNAPYPTKPIVPYIQTIHDRSCIEIMRGCPHSCKFCQARHFYFPLRTRSPETIYTTAQELLTNTGHDELSLVSLSSGDYPHLEPLLKTLLTLSTNKHVSLSIPSIRVEKNITQLPYYLSHIKKSGLTFAPEAGSERLRSFIGKDINVTYLRDAIFDA